MPADAFRKIFCMPGVGESIFVFLCLKLGLFVAWLFNTVLVGRQHSEYGQHESKILPGR